MNNTLNKSASNGRMPQAKRWPLLPFGAIATLLFANTVNRCADGYCYKYGWPWVAFYGWSDAGYGLDGASTYPGQKGAHNVNAKETS